MADSPFAPDIPEMDAGGSLEPQPQPGVADGDLKSKRLEAALAALSSLALFAPVGKVLGAAGGSLPKRMLAGAGVGVGVGALSEAAKAAGETHPSPMHELQSRLHKQGLYQGPIDGQSKPGGPTEKAVERLKTMFGEGEPLHVLRMIQDPKYRETEEAKQTETAKTNADLKKSELGLAETNRKKALDKAVADAAREGESWDGFAKRWGSYLGGGTAGAILGALPGRKATKVASKTAVDAETFSGKHFGGAATGAGINPDNVAGNAAAVNTFWERGGAKAPFANIATSGELSPKSMQFKVQDHPQAGDLYKPKLRDQASRTGMDAIAFGGAGLDYLGSGYNKANNEQQAEDARRRFAATQGAQDAVEATHAQGRANFWGNLQGAAGPFAAAYGLMRKVSPAKGALPSMEAQKDADAMRLKVQDYLNRQPAGGPKSAIPNKGGATAPIDGGRLTALPAPNGGGVGPHTSQQGFAAMAERRANFDKVLTGSMAAKTQEIIDLHISQFAKTVKDGPSAGKPLLTTRKVNELQRALEAEHGIPISNDRLRKELKRLGVALA